MAQIELNEEHSLMKILIITNLYTPFVIGGAETYVNTLTKALTDIGNEVVVLTSGPKNYPKEKYIGKIKIYYTYNLNLFFEADFNKKKSWQKFLWRIFSNFLPIFNLFYIYKIIKKEKPAIIHTHNLHGFHPLLLQLLKMTKIPIVHTLHDYHFICPRLSLLHRNGKICDDKGKGDKTQQAKKICQFYRKTMRRLSYNTFNTVTAPSSFIIEKHKEFGLLRNSFNTSLPLGSTFESEISKPKDYPDEVFSFLYIGALSEHKGIGNLLSAIERIELDFIISFAGSGELEKEIKFAANKDRRIKFLGFVSGLQKIELFKKTDCLLLPSIWYDNSPVVIYESFSFGIPVIASKIGGIPELVNDGINGYLTIPDDSKSFAIAMTRIMEEKNNYKKLSLNALASSKKLSFDEHVSEISQIYKKTIINFSKNKL